MTRLQDQDKQGRAPRELIIRSLAGDMEAFRTLMETHRDFAFGIAYRLLHDRDDSHDAVQEAFIRVWNNLARFRDEMKFTTWLYRIVVNVSYDRIKSISRRKRVMVYFGSLFDGGDPPAGNDPRIEVESADLRDHAVRIAKRLPPKQYLVFHLRDLLDLSVEETAATAGMSANSVKVNLCNARRKIRVALERLQENRS
ncbi:MAG TPA: RNA polymerase sigma factor [Bacteroidota bacterium]|nr:RNA polymerase sigma factor [Bacteroidota bacterium]